MQNIPVSQYPAGKMGMVFPCDVAFPCATQNELNLEDAKHFYQMVVL
jgi:glutamate dehydrogenase (NADP+)